MNKATYNKERIGLEKQLEEEFGRKLEKQTSIFDQQINSLRLYVNQRCERLEKEEIFPSFNDRSVNVNKVIMIDAGMILIVLYECLEKEELARENLKKIISNGSEKPSEGLDIIMQITTSLLNNYKELGSFSSLYVAAMFYVYEIDFSLFNNEVYSKMRDFILEYAEVLFEPYYQAKKILMFYQSVEDYKRYLMPVDMLDAKKITGKYGTNINNDWLFGALTFAINAQHEEDVIDGKHDSELIPIANQIDMLEKRYGLTDDEYFPLSEAPEEIQELNKRYVDVYNRRRAELFRKFKLDDFADFLEFHPEAFEKRFTEVRADLAHDNDEPLKKIILELETEAAKCYEIEAYNAASIMISAAIEAILYAECRKNNAFWKALHEHNDKMHKRKIKEQVKASSLTFGQLIHFAKISNIYPFDRDPEFKTLLALANDIRNVIHPGRKMSANVFTLKKGDFEFLFMLFEVLKSHYID